MAVGPLLKRLREEQGLSQRALAKKSGVPQPIISRIESGVQADALSDHVLRLAQALGMDIGDLKEVIEDELVSPPQLTALDK